MAESKDVAITMIEKKPKATKGNLLWYNQLYKDQREWYSFLEEDMILMLHKGLKSNAHLSLDDNDGKVILDVGCGVGNLLTDAAKIGFQTLIGIDLSKSAVRRAKKYVKEGEFIVADGHHLPFQKEVVDVITCVGSLEHFLVPAIGVFEMRKTLSNNGACLIVLPNRFFSYALLCKALGRYRYQPVEHDFSFSIWKRCFESVGFNVREMTPANPRSDSILFARSIPSLRYLYRPLRLLLGLYDKIRHSLPKFSSYHVTFVLKKGNQCLED